MRDAIPTEAELDAAAQKLSVSLMRLCEALDRRDAETYSEIPLKRLNWRSPKYCQESYLDKLYGEWFRQRA